MPGHPLECLVEHWTKLLDRAKSHKASKFSRDAERAMRYFRANVEEVWSEENIYGNGKEITSGSGFLVTSPESDAGAINPPSFRMCLAKAMELVQLYGPTLYPLNPIRVIEPRLNGTPPIEIFGNPQDQNVQFMWQGMAQRTQQENIRKGERARLVSGYLNYTPNELGLKHESRRVIDEAIVKGMGMWVHELHKPYDNSKPMVGSFYRTIDDLLLDPDERESINDCRWAAIRCTKPIWEVAEEYGISEDELKRASGKRESAVRSAEMANSYDAAERRRDGTAGDLLEYYKVYTKCGIGEWQVDKELRDRFPPARKYSYLVICKGIPYPLNLPKKVFNDAILEGNHEEIYRRMEWPVPYWLDGRWPFTPLYFHPQPNCIWPISHLKSGLSLLNFLNWCMGFLATKVRTSCTTHIAVLKAAGEELKKKLFSGQDFVLMELEEALGKSINEIVSFLQAPPMNGDIWRMVQWVMEEFEKSIGVNELLYGNASTQSRSSADAQIRHQQSTIRVDDMRNMVEDAETHLARSEALMCYWALKADDVVDVLGSSDAMLWQNLIENQDFSQVVKELDYRIEADSARKPNRQQKLTALAEFSQMIVPLLGQFAAGGAVGPMNAYIRTWGRLNDFNVEEMLLPEPPPPDPNQPTPEQMEMQMEQEKHQMEMQGKQADMQMKQAELQMKLQGQAADLQMQREKAQIDAASKAQELQMKQVEGGMGLRQKATEGAMQIRQQQLKNQQQVNFDAIKQMFFVRKEMAQAQAQAAKQREKNSA